MIRSIIRACMLLSVIHGGDARGQTTGCPPYDKKDVVIIGKQADLPDGFFVYVKAPPQDPAHPSANTGTGVYKSPMRTFAPAVIPNTATDPADNAEISDDGTWLSYTSGTTVYAIFVDGSHKTRVPTQGTLNKTAIIDRKVIAGIYHNGPYGPEIFYKESRTNIRSIAVTKTASGFTFGQDRLIAQLGQEATNCIAIARNHIVTNLSTITRDVTIPDSGRGTATTATIWQYSGTTSYGCNETMSHDGAMVCSAPGQYNDSLCLPQALPNGLGPWHKGFLLVSFQENTAPAIDIKDLALKSGVSINWCPPQYRFGGIFDVDISEWDHTNRNEYIIGRQKGLASPIFCDWMVHYPTNTWTKLTNDTTRGMCPAAFFYDRTTTAPRSGLAEAKSAAGIHALFDLRGRRLARLFPDHGGAPGSGACGLLVDKNGFTIAIAVRPQRHGADR